MTGARELQFPVSVRWRGGKLARADAPWRESLEVATPPELGGPDGYWSPEDLLVAAAASCYALTLAAAAERGSLPVLDTTVAATGRMGRADDGRFGITAVELDVRIESLPGAEAEVAAAAAAVEGRCFVGRALQVPVHVSISVAAVAGSPAG